MDLIAHDAVPGIVPLARRRLDRGPFDYEKSSDWGDTSLLSEIAATLGRCGGGLAHLEDARATVERIVDCDDPQAKTAARQALAQLARVDRMFS